MARFLALLALVLSLAFAGTALATEDDALYDDGADACLTDELEDGDDYFDDGDEAVEDDEDLYDDEELYEDEDELFRVAASTDDGCDDDPGADPEPAPESESDPGAAPRKPRATRGDDRLVGTDRRDRLAGLRGNDFLDGRGAADFLNGGPGDDEIVTGPAPKAAKARATAKAKGDRVLGGPGADVIRARNGARDRVDCGRGRDTVFAEAGDRVGKSCETVKYR